MTKKKRIGSIPTLNMPAKSVKSDEKSTPRTKPLTARPITQTTTDVHLMYKSLEEVRNSVKNLKKSKVVFSCM